MDITNFMNWFINLFINLFKWIYDTLDSIKFNGTSLLKYSIAIALLIPLITTLFTLVISGKVSRYTERRVRESDKRKDNDND